MPHFYDLYGFCGKDFIPDFIPVHLFVRLVCYDCISYEHGKSLNKTKDWCIFCVLTCGVL